MLVSHANHMQIICKRPRVLFLLMQLALHERRVSSTVLSRSGSGEESPSGEKQHPHQGQDPTLREGISQGTNGPMIHCPALVYTNWLCWPTDSWQGAGLWGTPVSLPPTPPSLLSRMAAA